MSKNSDFRIVLMMLCYFATSGNTEDLKNVALNKTTDQSSTDVFYSIIPLNSSFAVDGKTKDFIEHPCAKTKKDEDEHWWEVDLGDVFVLFYMVVYTEIQDFDFSVYVSDHRKSGGFDYGSSVYSENYTGLTQSVMNMTFPKTDIGAVVGRYVRIRKDSNDNSWKSLVLCEVEVYGELLKEWTISLKVAHGQSIYPASSVYNLWKNEYPVHDERKREVSFLPNTTTIRSSILENWKTYDISKVKVAFYTEGEEVANIVFDGTKSTKYNWFDCGRILSSSWSQLPTVTTMSLRLMTTERNIVGSSYMYLTTDESSNNSTFTSRSLSRNDYNESSSISTSEKSSDSSASWSQVTTTIQSVTGSEKDGNDAEEENTNDYTTHQISEVTSSKNHLTTHNSTPQYHITTDKFTSKYDITTDNSTSQYHITTDNSTSQYHITTDNSTSQYHITTDNSITTSKEKLTSKTLTTDIDIIPVCTLEGDISFSLGIGGSVCVNGRGLFGVVDAENSTCDWNHTESVPYFLYSNNHDNSGYDYFRDMERADVFAITVESIDKCLSKGRFICPQICKPLYGTYRCLCSPGYIGDGMDCRIDFNNLDKYFKQVVVTIVLDEPMYEWDDSLYNEDSEYRKNISSVYIYTLNWMLSDIENYKETVILRMSPGSIRIETGILLDINATNTNDIVDKLKSYMSSGKFGNLTVKNETLTTRSTFDIINELNITNGARVDVFKEDKITVSCKVLAVNVTSNLSIEWNFTGEDNINSTFLSRTRVEERKTDNTIISTLTLTNSTEKDTGKLTCTASIGNLSETTFTQITVYTFRLKTTSLSVVRGHAINVTCEVSPDDVPDHLLSGLILCENETEITEDKIHTMGNGISSTVNGYTPGFFNVSCGKEKDNRPCSESQKILVFDAEPRENCSSTCAQVCEKTSSSYMCYCWNNAIGREINCTTSGVYVKPIVTPITFETGSTPAVTIMDISANISTMINDTVGDIAYYYETIIFKTRLYDGGIQVDVGILVDILLEDVGYVVNRIQEEISSGSFDGYGVRNTSIHPIYNFQYIDNITLDSGEEIHTLDNEDIIIKCFATAVSVMYNLSYEWSFNNESINTTLMPQFEIDGSISVSILTIKDITDKDVGQIMCKVSLGKQFRSTSVDIHVYQFKLETSSRSVVRGHYMNVSSLVTPDDTVPRSILSQLKLCKDQNEVQINHSTNSSIIAFVKHDDLGHFEVGCGKKNGNCIDNQIILSFEAVNPKTCQSKNKQQNKTCPLICEAIGDSYNCLCWNVTIGDEIQCYTDFGDGLYLKSIVTPIILKTTTELENLEDRNSEFFIETESKILQMVNEIFKEIDYYKESVIFKMRLRPQNEGIDVDVGILVDILLDNQRDIVYQMQQQVYSGSIGNIPLINATIQPEFNYQYIDYIKHVSIDADKEINAFEQQNITIECRATAVSVLNTVSYRWKLDEYDIEPMSMSRFQISYTGTSSILTVRNIKAIDKGNITCIVKLVDQTKFTSIRLNVHTLYIKTSLRTVEKGDSVTIRCYIDPENKTNKTISLEMFQDGKRIDSDQLTFLVDSIEKKFRITKNTDVECTMTTPVYVVRKNLTITAFDSEVLFCSTDIDAFNNTWNDTNTGMIAYIACPSGFDGMITRQCVRENNVPVWRKVNFTDCTRTTFQRILTQLNRVLDGIKVNRISNVMKDFSEDLVRSNNGTLISGDLNNGVQVLNKVHNIYSEKKSQINDTDQEYVFSTTDILLSNDTEDNWQEVGNNNAAQLMRLTTEFSNILLEDGNTSHVSKENFVLEIKNVSVGEIKFPKEDETNDYLQLPEETILKSLSVDNTIGYTAVYYKTISQLLPKIRRSEKVNTTVITPVISLSIPGEQINSTLDPPLYLFFEHQEILDPYAQLSCTFWDFSLPNGGNWSMEGCVTFSNQTYTECNCSHLTNFAILMSVYKIPEEHESILSTISLFGCVVSIVSFVIVLVIYVREWRHVASDKSKILINICVSMLLAYILFLVGIERTSDKITCTAVAVTLHFLFLAALSLMAAEGIYHLKRVLIMTVSQRSISHIIIPLSWAIPALIVIITGSVTKLEGYGNSNACWLSVDDGLIWTFFVPCLVVVLFNMIITVFLIRKLFSTHATKNKSTADNIKTAVRSLATLATIFGLTWVFGALSFNKDTIVFSYLFVICNSFQGLFILIIHGLLNPNIQKTLKRRYSQYKKQRFDTNKTQDTHLHSMNNTDDSSNTHTDQIDNRFRHQVAAMGAVRLTAR